MAAGTTPVNDGAHLHHLYFNASDICVMRSDAGGNISAPAALRSIRSHLSQPCLAPDSN